VLGPEILATDVATKETARNELVEIVILVADTYVCIIIVITFFITIIINIFIYTCVCWIIVNTCTVYIYTWYILSTDELGLVASDERRLARV